MILLYNRCQAGRHHPAIVGSLRRAFPNTRMRRAKCRDDPLARKSQTSVLSLNPRFLALCRLLFHGLGTTSKLLIIGAGNSFDRELARYFPGSVASRSVGQQIQPSELLQLEPVRRFAQGERILILRAYSSPI